MAFKVQTDLDLNGFNLQNFCIQSYTNSESLTKTLGRKVFISGNTQSAENLREVIYDGTSWRVSAYLDDIEDIASSTEFIALKEKVELLSGDVDTDAIINNMKDVEAFLEGFTESQTLMDLLNSKANASDLADYLPLSGGTLHDSTHDILSLRRDDLDKNVFIRFIDKEIRTLGYLGVSEVDTPAFLNSKGDRIFPLLHSGNYSDQIGDYYLKTSGGTMNGTLTISPTYYLGLEIDSPDISLNQITLKTSGELKGVFQYNENWGVGFHHEGKGGIYVDAQEHPRFVDASSTVRTLIHSGNIGDYKAGDSDKLGGYDITEVFPQIMRARRYINAGVDLDSLIEGEAGWWSSLDNTTYTNAPKQNFGLLSARINSNYFCQLLFGFGSSNLMYRSQSFGSEIIWSDWKTIAFTDSTVDKAKILVDDNNSFLVYKTSAGDFYVGDNIYPTGDTCILGKNIILRYGTSANYGIILNSSGNVTIGSSDLATSDNGNPKLYVDGLLRLNTSAGEGNAITVTDSSALSTYGRAFSALYPNAVTGAHIDMYVGIANSKKNGGYLGFYYDGEASDNNRLSLGFFAVDNILNITASGNVGIGTSAPEYELDVNGSARFSNLATFSGGAYIPTGQTIQFGANGPTMEYEESTGAIKVTGNIYATGTVASGNVGEEGSGGGGGNASVQVIEVPIGVTFYDCTHTLNTKDVIVQIFEENSSGEINMILTDVEIVDANTIQVLFGRATTLRHRVHVIG